MKDRKYKYIEDVIEDYLSLHDEQIEIPLQLSKVNKKYEALINAQDGEVIKKGDLEDVFKVFLQSKKLEERQAEIKSEFVEIENYLKQFLSFIGGKQIAYEKWDD